MGGKGKGPQVKKVRKEVEVQASSSEEEEEQHAERIVDSDSSWELDPEQVVMDDQPAAVVEDYHLPPELLPAQEGAQLDPNSEDEDDHTGTWRPGDLESLILALNHYRSRIKGKFLGSHGGKTRRDQAWISVAGMYNSRIKSTLFQFFMSFFQTFNYRTLSYIEI